VSTRAARQKRRSRIAVGTPTEGTTLARLMALFLNFCRGDTSPAERSS
jgi:hypothetical protein